MTPAARDPQFPRNPDVSLTTPKLAGATVGGIYKER
jgi:hypothetical protein